MLLNQLDVYSEHLCDILYCMSYKKLTCAITTTITTHTLYTITSAIATSISTTTSAVLLIVEATHI